MDVDLGELSRSWLRQLRSQRKSPETLRSYERSIQLFHDHTGPPGLTKAAVNDWIATLDSQAAATVRLRLTAVKQFATWLAEEEDFDPDPILRVRAPKKRPAPVAHLTDPQIAALLQACDGRDGIALLSDKREKAILTLLLDTGMRGGELLAINMDDIDLDGAWVDLRVTKFDKPRRVTFSTETAATIDRYVRHRAKIVPAGAGREGPLWINHHGRRLTYSGVAKLLKMRADQAGVAGFHIHRTRHSAAVRWLAAGGTESGLMARCGWTDRSMIDRYSKTAAEDLAAQEFTRLRLALPVG